jgi:hypothetical protein
MRNVTFLDFLNSVHKSIAITATIHLSDRNITLRSLLVLENLDLIGII